MNPDLNKLQPYPFEKLAALKADCTPPASLTHIALSIGEPQHPTPAIISKEVSRTIDGLGRYPLTRGSDELRQAIADWLIRRFQLPADSIDIHRHVLPVNGTREALFAFAQCMIDRRQDPYVIMPNPFYQIYEGAAYLAGATPYFLNTLADNRFIPDFDQVSEDIWERCQILYICSPGNPTGAVIGVPELQRLISLADQHDFIIASDECYSELYADESEPPAGLLQAAALMGRNDYARCVVFHSLSKRSNAPGLRSGFVAGDTGIMQQFLLYRTYHGCAMSPPTQMASIQAWGDEAHVIENRRLYRDKFAAVIDILSPVLDIEAPAGAFYLWVKTPVSDTEFARGLFAQQHVTVLPGSYLSRQAHGINPGSNRVRMALVASLDECVEAANRIKNYINTL
jgi:N-succinyldiaminopimelate aminotransferase